MRLLETITSFASIMQLTWASQTKFSLRGARRDLVSQYPIYFELVSEHLTGSITDSLAMINENVIDFWNANYVVIRALIDSYNQENEQAKQGILNISPEKIRAKTQQYLARLADEYKAHPATRRSPRVACQRETTDAGNRRLDPV